MRRPTKRELSFISVVAVTTVFLVYSVLVQLELGVFLATAIGSLSYVIVALYGNYIVTSKLDIAYDPDNPDLYNTELMLVDPKTQQPNVLVRSIRVLVHKVGSQG